MTRWLGILGLSLLLCGCISVGLGLDDPPPAIRYHVLDGSVFAGKAGKAEPSAKRVIAVRTFGISTRHDLRVVALEGPGSISYADYERWGDEPFEAATLGFREAFAATGAFKGVLGGSSEPEADYVVDGDVLVFDVDTSGEGPYTARFAARVSLFERDTGRLLDSRISEGHAALAGRSFDGLGTAMAKALSGAATATLDVWHKRRYVK